MDMSFRPVAPAHYLHHAPAYRTFSEGAESYIEHGGEAKSLPPILAEIGAKSLGEIFPFDVKALANSLYPEHQNSTRNRCVITPVRAVFSHSYDRGWGPLIRLRNFRQDAPKRKKAASQAWVHAFVRQCAKDDLPHVAALVMFMSQTGARVSEAIALEWKEVDLLGRTALILKTKTGRNSTRFLTDQLLARLHQLRETAALGDRVFRYTNRHSVNERILAVCRRASITYKPSHTCGRHAFANNALSLGLDVKTTMDAGGWRSVAVFLGTYANPRNAGRMVAERLNLYQYDNEL
ncbi:tyrosine-type recombinase/integrase [Rhizobium sp. LC145]|uniref:tyrosine-type recombinase/integrase n=1 Tax=Rhizobium sp. LC145 TaxID=1120688 RepID=UPI00062A3D53|nr:tyrosine-type recombinase/integrase [Rhizobium sp. LC145]KKX28208.1 hypothetical protein YH62_19135 [Rhizobium sp. LC145]